MLEPIPVVATETGDTEDAPSGAVPLALYGAGGGSGDVEAFLASLPGYDPGNDSLVLGFSSGSLQWVDISG